MKPDGQFRPGPLLRCVNCKHTFPKIGAVVEIDYTNYRGERAVRMIVPTGRLVQDETYHPGVPWLIEARDVEKNAIRTFDPAKIHRWGKEVPPAPSEEFAGLVRALVSQAMHEYALSPDCGPDPEFDEAVTERSATEAALLGHGSRLEGEIERLRGELAQRDAALAQAAGDEWLSIESAPKDLTPRLLLLKDPIPRDREDVRGFDGLQFVGAHQGLTTDGFDVGWHFAAPVGCGGIPDDWIKGWRPLPAPPGIITSPTPISGSTIVPKDQIEDLRQRSVDLQREAWRRSDGGQELMFEAIELERQADAIEAALLAQQTPGDAP